MKSPKTIPSLTSENNMDKNTNLSIIFTTKQSEKEKAISERLTCFFG